MHTDKRSRDTQAIVYSEAGRNHPNEDVVQTAEHGDLLLCALADGQGGRAGGALAARIAVRSVLEAAQARSPARLQSRFLSRWSALLRYADRATQCEPEAGFCTLIALGVGKRGVCGASVGDSGTLLVPARGDATLLTENQHKNPPVGTAAATPVRFHAAWKPGDRLVVVSDGVWRCLGWDRIAAIVRENDPERVSLALRNAAVSAGGGALGDDFSFALLVR